MNEYEKYKEYDKVIIMTMAKRTVFKQIPDECAYCSRDTVEDEDHLLLFDRVTTS
jgi:hypothetical protein